MNIPKRTVGAAFAVILLAICTVNVEAQVALQPVNLRCQQRVNPLGVGDATPRLSWQLQSGGTGGTFRFCERGWGHVNDGGLFRR